MNYTRRLAEANLVPSVGSVGDSYDNPVLSLSKGPWPRRLTASTKPRSSGASGHGRARRQWKWQPCAGSLGSTIIACSVPSDTSRLLRQKPTTMQPTTPSIWLHDTIEFASGNRDASRPDLVPASTVRGVKVSPALRSWRQIPMPQCSRKLLVAHVVQPLHLARFLAGCDAFVLGFSVLGLRISRLDFFCPLDMLLFPWLIGFSAAAAMSKFPPHDVRSTLGGPGICGDAGFQATVARPACACRIATACRQARSLR